MRNSKGNFIVARARRHAHTANALTAEALDGARLSAEWGVEKVVIERDSQSLVHMWRKSIFQRSEVASILIDLIHVQELSRSFSVFEVVFAGRVCKL